LTQRKQKIHDKQLTCEYKAQHTIRTDSLTSGSRFNGRLQRTDCVESLELHKSQCLKDASSESRFWKINRSKKQNNCLFVLVFRKHVKCR